MQRILVIGSGGAGKSTLAVTLAGRLGLPLIHLDRHYWHAGWRPTPSGEWERIVAALAAEPRWVMDGNYGGTLDLRLQRCDTVVFLDLPRVVCLARVLRRWFRHRGRTRPELTPGCEERLNREFLAWIWNYPARTRPRIVERLQRLRPDQRLIMLRSRRAVTTFIETLPPGQPASMV